MENNLPWKPQPTRDGKLWKNITCTQNSNGRRIERPRHISLLNSSQKASRCATRRQINSADGSIVEAEAPTKISKLLYTPWLRKVGPCSKNYGQIARFIKWWKMQQIYPRIFNLMCSALQINTFTGWSTICIWVQDWSISLSVICSLLVGCRCWFNRRS